MHRRRSDRLCPALLVAVSAAYGWWVTGLPAFSATAAVAVVGAGAVVAIAAFSIPARAHPAHARLDVRSGVLWSALVTALAVWQLASWTQEPRSEHPTLSALANAALEPRPVRAVAFALWVLGAGWLGRR